MQWILHCLDYKQCLELLKNCYEALPVNGKVIVVDLVIPESPDTNLLCKSVFQFDVFMLNTNGSGKERTEKELESLAKGAGFSRVRVACCAYSFSVRVLQKHVRFEHVRFDWKGIVDRALLLTSGHDKWLEFDFNTSSIKCSSYSLPSTSCIIECQT